MRVYGSLMWALGKVLRGAPEVPRVVVGSFWDAEMPFEDDDLDGDDNNEEENNGTRLRHRFLKMEMKKLLRRLAALPDKVVAKKIDEMSKRLVQVKVCVRICVCV